MKKDDAPSGASAPLPPPKQAPMVSNHPDPVAREAFNRIFAERAKRQAERPLIEKQGREALARLFGVAKGDTGQSRRVAAFLLGCYNGFRFPFDLTDFRGLDYELFDDCLAVLRMDYQPKLYIHKYFAKGQEAFEQLAKDHGIVDVQLLKAKVQAGNSGLDQSGL